MPRKHTEPVHWSEAFHSSVPGKHKRGTNNRLRVAIVATAAAISATATATASPSSTVAAASQAAFFRLRDSQGSRWGGVPRPPRRRPAKRFRCAPATR
jgi:hypothetical protein